MKINRMQWTLRSVAAGACALLFSSSVLADGSISNVTITDLAINRTSGNYVYIKVSGTPSGAPACSTNGYWQFTLPLVTDADQKLYASLLAAFVSGLTVAVSGMGQCDEHGQIESLRSVQLTR